MGFQNMKKWGWGLKNDSFRSFEEKWKLFEILEIFRNSMRYFAFSENFAARLASTVPWVTVSDSKYRFQNLRCQIPQICDFQKITVACARRQKMLTTSRSSDGPVRYGCEELVCDVRVFRTRRSNVEDPKSQTTTVMSKKFRPPPLYVTKGRGA